MDSFIASGLKLCVLFLTSAICTQFQKTFFGNPACTTLIEI
jgi:hypothetical protein